MRSINKLFLVACGYTVLILTLLYIFAAISGFIAPAISLGQFALVLSSGLVIALAEFMYDHLKLNKLIKCLIHYVVLLIAFCLIFIISGKISAQRPAAVFVAIMLYTIMYFVIWSIVHFSRKAINGIDDKLDAKKKSKKPQTKKGYKSLYSEGD